MNIKTLVLSCVALACLSAPAWATPTTFFGEDVGDTVNAQQPTTNADKAHDAFFANLSGVGTETFESYPTGTGLPLVISFGTAGSATLEDGRAGGVIESGNDGFGRYPISGTQFLVEDTGSFSATFSKPVSAFGFYGTDIGDFGGQLTLGLTDVMGVTSTLIVPNTIGENGSTNGGNLYFGFFDTRDTYTSISFDNSTTEDVFGFDDFSIGSATQVVPISTAPEPSTWALMILGIGGVGAAFRQARRMGVRLNDALTV